MNHATITRPPYQPPRVVQIRGGLFWFPLLVLLMLGGGAYWYFTHRSDGKSLQTVVADATGAPSWLPQRIQYPPEKPPPEPPKPPVIDEDAIWRAEMLKKLQAMQNELEQVKRQKAPAAPVPPPKPAPKTKYAAPLFMAGGTKEGVHGTPEDPTYLLAPGDTKIPCTLETAMNSDVEGFMTAKVRTNVYDSKTRTKVLIPQNSTILGRDKSSGLLYGNERIPVVSMTLALPDGSSVDLGEAPIVDQQGISGLTGKVNNHWGRLLGAVFVKGALQGGAMATRTMLQEAGPAGTIGSSIAQSGAGIGQTTFGRQMDTRPTIEVDAGQLCTIILIKPLQLKAWAL